MTKKLNSKAVVQADWPAAHCKKLTTGGYVVKGVTHTTPPVARSARGAWRKAERQTR